MRKHNTLFGTATQPTKKFETPKRVVTVPTSGNLGKGLTHEQYKNILDNIDDLQNKATIQRNDYDAYVDYNEKATTRSDYNIADITELAKSLERLIYDLQQKQKQQEKWNAYFKQLLIGASDRSDVTAIFDEQLAQLEDKLRALELKLENSFDTSGITELFQTMEQQTKQIQNLVRILKQLPGFVTSIEKICSTSTSTELVYNTIKFDSIDLDAELPVEPDPDPDEEIEGEVSEDKDADGGDEESSIPEDNRTDDTPDPVLDPIKSALTEVTMQFPSTLIANRVAGEHSQFADINSTLKQMKDAIESLASAESTEGISILFTAYIKITGTQDAPSAILASKRTFDDGLSLKLRVNGRTLYLEVEHSTTMFTIYSVSTNIVDSRDGTNYTPDKQNSGDGNGGLVSVSTKITNDNQYKQTVMFRQFSQGNDHNNSWSDDNWYGGYGVTGLFVTGYGVYTKSSSSSSGITIDLPTEIAKDQLAGCGTKTEKDITPKPEPAPEEDDS